MKKLFLLLSFGVVGCYIQPPQPQYIPSQQSGEKIIINNGGGNGFRPAYPPSHHRHPSPPPHHNHIDVHHGHSGTGVHIDIRK